MKVIRIGRRARLVLLLLGIAMLCPSCFYSRLLSFKQQLGLFDKYVVITNGGHTLEFLKPVVETDDLTSLTGISPSRIDRIAADQQVHTYRYRCILPRETNGTPQVLSFSLRFSANKLCAADYPPALADVLGTNLVVAAVKAVGDSRLLQRERKLEWALGPNQTTKLIPSLADVTKVLGPSQDTNGVPSSSQANYLYLLEGTNGNTIADAMLKANFSFDPKSSLMRHCVVKLGSLELEVDLPVSP